MQRDLVILAGAEQTPDAEQAFEQFKKYARNGGVYMKIGRGAPRHAAVGCNAYVVLRNHIVGVLEYAGVDESFVPGGNLGGEADPYVMEPGPALRFVGSFREVHPVPYRQGFRGWEYLPAALAGRIKIRKPKLFGMLK